MKIARIFGIMLALCGLCSAQALLPTQAGQVSIDSIQQDFDAKNYTDVIRKATVALNYKGPSAAQLDKAKLYALKAEAHLRLRQFVPAADTFTLLAKESKDEKEIALAKSTALLIRRSAAGQYAPKGPSTQPGAARGAKAPPIGIVDPETRGRAMSALLEDELKTAIPKVQAANKQQSLPPLMNSINDVRDLRMLEMTATDQDTRSAQLFASLENRAGQLMGDAIKTMSQKVEQISKNAGDGTFHYQESPYGGGRRTVTSKNGLTSNDSDTLKEVIDTSKKISATCEEFAKVVPSGAGNADSALAQVDADALRLAGRADEILHANYDPEITDSPTGVLVLPPQVTPVIPGSRVVPAPRPGNR